MSNETNKYDPIRREISLKELILVIRSYVIYLWRKKYWLLLFVGLGSAIMYTRAKFLKPAYAAEISFMVNEGEAGGMGGMGSLLDQFGFGGGGGQGGVNLAQLVKLASSRMIGQRVLFDTAYVNGRSDLMANHMIDVFEYHEYYRERGSTYLQDFYFSHDSVASFSTVENRMFLQLHYHLADDEPPFEISYNEEVGIVTIRATTENELFTYELVHGIYNHIASFYTDKTETPQARTIKVMQTRADSLGRELRQREYQLASMEDRTMGLSGRSELVKMSRLQREASVISGIYTEVLKNIETTRFMLNNSQPVFKVLDAPVLPLYRQGTGALINGIVGAFFGAFAGVVILILFKIYQDVVSTDLADEIVIK